MRLTIQKLIYGGVGVGEIDGKKVFVPLSAPGDLLEVDITKDHENYAEAQIVKIIEPAGCRVNPLCPVFGKCGGCQWQHISYKAQLEWKRLILIETFERIGKFTVSTPSGSPLQRGRIMPTLASPTQWHYRNRIQLHVDSRGRAGFYKPKSKEVVEFDKCFIAEEKINKRLNEMRISLKFRMKGIALRLEEGPSFSQINTGQNENLKKIVREWIDKIPHDSILELYAGAGNFTFEIAKIAKKVVASDIDGRAIKFAKERQEKEGIENVEFFCADAKSTIKKYRDTSPFERGTVPVVPPVVLIDPPRKGCAEIIEDIVSLKPEAIIYISCDPATLARDIRGLGEHGYKLKKSLPVDMFPQTYHIESINLLV